MVRRTHSLVERYAPPLGTVAISQGVLVLLLRGNADEVCVLSTLWVLLVEIVRGIWGNKPARKVSCAVAAVFASLFVVVVVQAAHRPSDPGREAMALVVAVLLPFAFLAAIEGLAAFFRWLFTRERLEAALQWATIFERRKRKK